MEIQQWNIGSFTIEAKTAKLTTMNSIKYETFLEFLRRNDCEEAFQRAFYEQNGNNFMDRRLWEFLDPDECFINTCLNWSKTKEGRDYWKTIDELWYQEQRLA